MAFEFMEDYLVKQLKVPKELAPLAFGVFVVVASYVPMWVCGQVTALLSLRQPKLWTDPSELRSRFSFNESGSNMQAMETQLKTLLSTLKDLQSKGSSGPRRHETTNPDPIHPQVFPSESDTFEHQAISTLEAVHSHLSSQLEFTV